MNEASELEQALVGKTIQNAKLGRGTVVLRFTDGTSFEREKTYEGIITATVRAADKTILLTVRI